MRSTVIRIFSFLVVVAVLSCGLMACGGGSSASVNVNETHASSGDTYACDPTTLTVNKGDTVTFKNNSDELQDFDEGDASKAGVDFKIPVNESKDVVFNSTGTFAIKSEKGATSTVTVK